MYVFKEQEGGGISFWIAIKYFIGSLMNLPRDKLRFSNWDTSDWIPA